MCYGLTFAASFQKNNKNWWLNSTATITKLHFNIFEARWKGKFPLNYDNKISKNYELRIAFKLDGEMLVFKVITEQAKTQLMVHQDKPLYYPRQFINCWCLKHEQNLKKFCFRNQAVWFLHILFSLPVLYFVTIEQYNNCLYDQTIQLWVHAYISFYHIKFSGTLLTYELF